MRRSRDSRREGRVIGFEKLSYDADREKLHLNLATNAV